MTKDSWGWRPPSFYKVPVDSPNDLITRMSRTQDWKITPLTADLVYDDKRADFADPARREKISADVDEFDDTELCKALMGSPCVTCEVRFVNLLKIGERAKNGTVALSAFHPDYTGPGA